MSSGTISQTPIRFVSPRGGSTSRQSRNKQDPDVIKRDRGAIELIALQLVQRRVNEREAILWTYDPKLFKSQGRRTPREELVRRKVKRQLCAIAQTNAIDIMHDLDAKQYKIDKRTYDRLVPRAVELIFANGWMQIDSVTQIKYKIDKSRRIKGKRHERKRYDEHRMIAVATVIGRAAVDERRAREAEGRRRALEVGHPSTGNVTVIRKEVAA